MPTSSLARKAESFVQRLKKGINFAQAAIASAQAAIEESANQK
jgi:hypothetical protein